MSEQNTQAVIDTAVRATTPTPLADGFTDGEVALYSVVVPAGSHQLTIDTEAVVAKYRDRPRRKTGQVSLSTPASLTQYVNAHKSDGTVLYADWRESRVVGVLNDHDTAAGWADHRAVLDLVPTPEWTCWTEHDGAYMSQVEFAEHIIDTTADVVEPPAADLLEMAETFNATKAVQFKSGNRLKDGQRQLTYHETIDANAGTHGNVTIPDSVLLRLAPFDGADPVEMSARIRYRIDGGNLRIGYVLDRPDLVLRAAVAAVVAGVEQQTGLSALWGTPRP